MPELVIDGLRKRFGGTTILNGISLTVRDGEFFTLLGPSGCGKSTTLNCVAGLEHPDGGSIRVAGTTFVDHAAGVFLEPEARNLGLVFQSYALWPHMTIAGNLAYPLKIRKVGRARQRELIDDALDNVGMKHLRDRYPHQLSGGQQQRVALARALVYAPSILLLDEPLSNLDAQLRDQARAWLKRLQAQVGITTVYVTHDQIEALALSDRIAVMQDGEMLQVGTPREIYETPASPEVAAFIGRCNFLTGTVHEQTGRHTVVALADDGRIRAARADWAAVGDRVTVAVRAENVLVDDAAGAGHSDAYNRLDAEVVHSAYVGARYEHRLRIGASTVQAESVSEGAGAAVSVAIRPEHCIVYPGTARGELAGV
ncbi:ABC transporter ATP-binding protein [Nocardiopsis sediminis]|uniref:ABC transporter ATP-binding protein n=1 Tax=Nocardiopsis sediminis TaxID=1778267 RepID=A0ABV8FS68_9ACTN